MPVAWWSFRPSTVPGIPSRPRSSTCFVSVSGRSRSPMFWRVLPDSGRAGGTMDTNRRDFLKTVTGLSLGAPYVSRFTQPSAAARRFDPGFSSAHDALRALREGTVSSRDLTQLVYQRIHKHNPKVNT